MPIECIVELRVTPSHSLVSTEPNASVRLILDPAKFSTLSILIGVTVKILRAVQRFKNLIESRATDQPANAVEEAMEAELLWVRAAKSCQISRL